MSVRRTIQEWLESGESPVDFYELLGMERCHPDRLVLLRAAREAKGVLHQLRAGLNPDLMSQWQGLERQCAQAEQTFGNAAESRAYDERVQQELCERYLAEHEVQSGGLRADAIRRWLNGDRHVHAGRVERLIQRVLSAAQSGSQAEPAAPSTSQGKFFSYTAGPMANRKTSERTTAPKPVTGTVPSGKAAPSGGETPKEHRPEQGGHSPISSGASRPNSVTPGFSRDIGHGFDWSQDIRRRPKDSAVFWIVGSAIGAALVMGLLAALFILPKFPNRVDPATGTREPSAAADGNQPVATAGKSEDVADDPESTSTGSPAREVASSGDSKSSPVADDAGSSESAKASSAASEKPATAPPLAFPTTAVQFSHGKPVHVIAWNPDGKKIATSGDDSVIRIWDVQGKELQGLTGAAPAVPALAWSDTTPGILASAGSDGSIQVWDVEKRVVRQTMPGTEKGNIQALAWKDAKQIVSADSKGILTTWDLPTGRPQKSSFDQAEAAGSIRCFLSNSGGSGADRFIAGHLDGSVVFWALNQSQPVVRMLLPESGALWQQLIRTGHISSAAADDVAGSKTTAAPDGAGPARNRKATPYEGTRCSGIATFGTNDSQLALANGDVEIWDVAHAACVRVRVLPGRDGEEGFQLVASNSRGNLLAAVDGTGELTVWSTARWKVVFAQKILTPATSLAWSTQNAERLALATGNGSVALFLVKDDKSLEQDPPFAVDDILTKAREFKKDEEWRMLRRAVSLLDMYRLPIAARNEVDQFEFDLRKGADEMLASVTASKSNSEKSVSSKLAPKAPALRRPVRGHPTRVNQPLPKPAKPDFAERVMDLQEVIDLDAEGTAGKKARELLERAYR